MKRYFLSAIAGAMTMLLVLIAAARISQNCEQSPQEYNHVNYVSHISKEACFLCSDTGSPYWGYDNVGILNLNTFDVLQLEINRYDDSGEMVKEPAGIMLSNSMNNMEAQTYVHAYTHPDQAFAQLQLTGVQYAIDRESVQGRLCQDCLDSINNLWFTTQPPAEFAVISFADRTIQPLLNAYPWFSAGNFGVDCEFKPDGAIDLLVHYCPNRYAK